MAKTKLEFKRKFEDGTKVVHVCSDIPEMVVINYGIFGYDDNKKYVCSWIEIYSGGECRKKEDYFYESELKKVN